LITSELAKRRKVSLQSASVLVRAMVDKGWLTRVPDPADGRQFLLQITPEGLEKADATRNEIINYLVSFLGELSAEEIAAAQIFLPALSRILTQHSADEHTEEES
jgi:DNA-binding MarR family transcriptional regulator